VAPTVDAAAIAPLKSLLGERPPAPSVKFSLLNVVYAYAHAMRLMAGFDPDNASDFVAVCLAVSAALRDGQNFDSADMAVESAAAAANQVLGAEQRLNFVKQSRISKKAV
jgi:hypothetical protein